jgi:hypothetical protein
VVQNVRPGVEYRAQRGLVTLEIRYQHFDAALGPPRMDGAHRGRERAGAEVLEVITIDRGDDDVVELHGVDGVGELIGLLRIKGEGRAMRHVAVGARARADVAHDHERRRAVVPALADVGAVRFLADRMQTEVAHQALDAHVALRAGRANLQPVGLLRPGRRCLADVAAPMKRQRRGSGHGPSHVIW